MAKIRIIVAQLPSLLPKDWQDASSLAIVVDTLRFTSTACQALAAGAKAIQIAEDIDQAKRIAAEVGPNALLCGERHCKTIEGFHLGNSPLEFTNSTVAKRELVFSTTNGTRAVLAVAKAKGIALGSLVNRTSVSEYAYRLLMDEGKVERIVVVCAGTDGEIAAEDVLTAGAIVEKLVEWIGPNASIGHDSNRIARDSWQMMFQRMVASAGHSLHQLQRFLENTKGGRNLIEAGFKNDISAVSNVDSLNVVPVRTTDGFRFESSNKLASE